MSNRYEVSDGVTGEFTITGYFRDPLAAYESYEKVFGAISRGAALIYRLDGDDEMYGVNDVGGIFPMSGVYDRPENDVQKASIELIACNRIMASLDKMLRYYHAKGLALGNKGDGPGQHIAMVQHSMTEVIKALVATEIEITNYRISIA